MTFTGLVEGVREEIEGYERDLARTTDPDERASLQKLINDLRDEARRFEGTASMCVHCGGPITLLSKLHQWKHDNTTGWYAGRQMDHDAEERAT